MSDGAASGDETENVSFWSRMPKLMLRTDNGNKVRDFWMLMILAVVLSPDDVKD
jgi:hypothetical protein